MSAVLCRKAATQLNAAIFFKANIDEETRIEIYRSFILSNFNYCPLVWHFCGVLNTKKGKSPEKGHYDLYNDFTLSHDELLARGTIAHYT